IFVQKGTIAITWPSPASIAYGTRLSPAQLKATANVPGSFTYDPSFAALLDTGTQTLHATFTPASLNYDVATATTTIDVTPGTQSISWPTPAAITYGDSLTATQLDAVVTCSGTALTGEISYTPSFGTIFTSCSNT